MSIMVSTHFPADVPHQSSDYYHEHLKCKNGSEALPGKLCVCVCVYEMTTIMSGCGRGEKKNSEKKRDFAH